MAKITIPTSALVGTSLSKEELKSILGGTSAGKVCSCTYAVGTIGQGGELVAVRIQNAGGEDECRSKCQEACSSENGRACTEDEYAITYK